MHFGYYPAMSYEPDWVAFLREMKGKPASILVDRAARELDPQSRPGTWVEVRIKLQRPSSDGLVGGDELEVLSSFDDELVEAVAYAIGGLCVGSITTGGRRHWCFYGEHGARAAAAAEGILAKHREYVPKTEVASDPAWRMYAQLLTPTAREDSMIQDILVIQQLAQNGDSGAKPRLIEHFAYFPSRETQQKFAAWLPSAGFKVTEAAKHADERGAFKVLFTHHGPADIESLPDRTWAARQAAATCEGEYDGWGCALCTD